MFLRVSAIRVDGGVQATDFIGYAAESCAYQYYNNIKNNKHIKFVLITERHDGPPVSWEIRVSEILFPTETD